MSMTAPAARPVNPRFSSGPCAKIPNFSLDMLADAPLGRSHRAAVGKSKLAEAIELRQQHEPQQIFQGLLESSERFTLTLCNPPFHASAAEAASGSTRKWKNLGKLDPTRKLPVLNFGGQSNELWCAGGEVAFLRRMARESATVAGQVLWFSSLVSKAGNLAAFKAELQQAGALEVRQVDMAQGNKQSRFLAWTFHDVAARRAWLHLGLTVPRTPEQTDLFEPRDEP